MGFQSRWYHQHRSPCAPDRLEPNETRGSPCSNVVKAQVHLVHRRADLNDQAKCASGYGYWPRGAVLPAGEHQARPAGPAVRDPAVFHDHGGFTTLWSIRPFAIMKIRSGIRIAPADMGGRAGYARSAGAARPGTGDPAARAGQPRFPQATAVRTTSGRAVSRTGALFPARPKHHWDPSREERATRLASPSAICDRAGYLCYLGATCPFAHRAYRACIFIACTPHRPVMTGAQGRSPMNRVRAAVAVGRSQRMLTGSSVRRG
jgi:hypothetical protein